MEEKINHNYLLRIRPDSVYALEDKEIRSVLRRYVNVVENKLLAKFLLLKSFEVEIPKDASLNELWKFHDDLMKEFNESEIQKTKFYKTNLLTLKKLIANKIVKECQLCEWKCKVDRTKGQKGFCQVGNEIRISSEFVHMGEESFITPSHTIFFWSCNMQCIFCQNYTISYRLEKGKTIEPKVLAKIIERRRREGCRNCNNVGGEPCIYLHKIFEVFEYVNENVPIVWNSNMYMSEISMKLLDGFVDVYLTDFKFGPGKCSEELTKVKNYWDIITRNHLIASKQAEVVIRHLILPNHVECCTFPILEWISKNLGKNCIVNLMDQYYPCFKALENEKINRRITREEYRKALEKARELGLIVKS
jgi:putative pyruvate formate lyase activating enzyme